MLFIKLTSDQKTIKRLEAQLDRYQRAQAEFNQQVTRSLETTANTMKLLHERMEQMEFAPHHTLN